MTSMVHGSAQCVQPYLGVGPRHLSGVLGPVGPQFKRPNICWDGLDPQPTGAVRQGLRLSEQPLDEFTFRFNRRTSRHRGLLFYRLLEGAVAAEPLRYRQLIRRHKPRREGSTPTPPSNPTRVRPRLETSGRPWRTTCRFAAAEWKPPAAELGLRYVVSTGCGPRRTPLFRWQAPETAPRS